MPRPRYCGKLCFTETEAKCIVLASLYYRHHPSRHERDYYYCRGCRAWHTTSQ